MTKLLCTLVGHRRSRNVWHDNVDFRSRCVRCEEPLIRGDNGWRRFEADRDHDALRASKGNDSSENRGSALRT